MSSVPNVRENLFLIGEFDTQIYGNKLPSRLQVLKVFFFNLRHLKLTVCDSASLAIKETQVFWEKSKIPTQQNSRCITKLESLYDTHQAYVAKKGWATYEH